MKIVEFIKEYINKVIEFERNLRIEEPNTYFWDIDEKYLNSLNESFNDSKFNTSLTYLALIDENVVGRIDASLSITRNDPNVSSCYLDWICVLKSKRHQKVAQTLLNALKQKLKEMNVTQLVALMAENEESKRFYESLDNVNIQDKGVWINI